MLQAGKSPSPSPVTNKSPPSITKVDKYTIRVDGKDYTVSPNQQASFITKMGGNPATVSQGISGSSSSGAVTQTPSNVQGGSSVITQSFKGQPQSQTYYNQQGNKVAEVNFLAGAGAYFGGGETYKFASKSGDVTTITPTGFTITTQQPQMLSPQMAQVSDALGNSNVPNFEIKGQPYYVPAPFGGGKSKGYGVGVGETGGAVIEYKTEGDIANFLSKTSPFTYVFPSSIKSYEAQFYKSAIIGVEKHPVKTAIVFGAGVLSAGIAPLFAGAGGVAGALFEGASYTLPVIYVGSKAAQLTAEPTGTGRVAILGETTSTELLPALAGYGVGTLNPYKLESATIKATTTQGVEVPYRGIGLRTGEGAGKPLVGWTSSKGVTFGTPNSISFEGNVIEFQPMTGSQTAIFKSNIGSFITKPSQRLVEGLAISPELQQEFAIKGIEAEYQLRGQQSIFTNDNLLNTGTERLTSKAVGNVLDFSKEYGGVPYGSFSSRPQLASGVVRPVGDIDIHFDTTSEKALGVLTSKALSAVKSSGMRARIPIEEPFTIETFKGGQWTKAIELKGVGIGATPEQVVPGQAFGYNLDISKNTIDVGNYKIASIVGESQRKLAASVAIRDEGALGVTHTGRFKDVPDFFRIIYTQTESAKSMGLSAGKGESFLQLAEKLGVNYKTGAPVSFPITSSSSAGSYGYSSVGLISVGLVSPFVKGSGSPSSTASYKLYPSPSKLFSPSPSLSLDLSPSPSPSPTSYKFSPSPSPSPSSSPSPYSFSPSLSPSPSPSPYSISPSPSPSPYSYLAIPSPSPFPSGFPRINFGDVLTSRKFGAKARRKYTPSFDALLKGIRGKAPKSQAKLALGTRPVPKGFKWEFGRNKMPKMANVFKKLKGAFKW